ncbi:MAG: B12-binding domain-containing radical SAM protein, partial [Candidatus Hodarchaeota archaeon]
DYAFLFLLGIIIKNDYNNMKILLINLPRYKGISVTRESRCEVLIDSRVDVPITLLILASILKQNKYKVNFIDANGLNLTYDVLINIIKKIPYDCIIFTFASRIIEYELKICNLVKSINPSCITIGYSWFAIKYYKDILKEYENLDILIIEEPFYVIENLIKILIEHVNLSNAKGIAYRDENFQINRTSEVQYKKDFNDLPLPAYELLTSFKPYHIISPLLRPYSLIYAGKGCPFGCTYCNVSGTEYSGRTPEKIIEELKLLKKIGKVKYVWFFDEIFTIDRKKVMLLCQMLIREKIKMKWFCDSRVDLVDKKLLGLMRRAGCIGISYGVESGSQKILNLMNKKITIEQAKNALKWTKQAHIPVQLNLILGYIGENNRTLKETEIFIRETLPEFLQINIIKAHESTKFNDIALKNKWINNTLDWKTKLASPWEKLTDYAPYKLNLWELKGAFQKMNYYNLKWWFCSIKTLLRNSRLIIPIISIFLKKSESIRLI